MEVTPQEIRVLGCLIEKQRTTPDGYPLTLNALRLACNQSTNRDPVVDYDEDTVREAAQRLGRRGWVRFATGQGSRTAKYRQIADEALGLADGELVLLGVLMLRGAQTPGELKARSDRMHHFADLSAVDETLERLIGRDLVARLPRRPGQKEERYAQLLSDDDEATETPAATHPAAPVPAVPALPGPPPLASDDRLDRLEAEVRSLREQVDALRRELGI